MTKPTWVSASDAGRASFCPHYLEHKNKGSKVSNSAQQARLKGDIEHLKINDLAEDKRCYVASYLYGVDDDRTVLLRQYRDSSLKKSFYGRLAIKLYYAASPSLVTLSKRFSVIEKLTRIIVVKVLSKIEDKQ